MRTRVIFLVGGPDFHPANEQAATIIQWLGPDYACHTAESLAAFEHLTECDLLVLMGQHWTGWEGRYRSPSHVHRRNFERYVQSGKPLLSFHAAIASYDDWPRFAELIGAGLKWETAQPSPVGDFLVRIRPSGHPIVEGMSDFQITDELLPGVQIMDPARTHVLADALWADRRAPVILTTEGGRILGAGKSVYISLGHDMRAMQSPGFQQLIRNSIDWCLKAG